MFFRVFLNKRREKNNFMKKTNRIIALAMAAMTALSMTACSGSAKETTEAESAERQPQRLLRKAVQRRPRKHPERRF